MTQRIEYSLDDQPVAASQRREGEERMRRCPTCFLVCSPSATECASCGHVFEGKDVAHEAGELVPLTQERAPRPPLEVLQAAWDRIEEQREALGFRDGWALYRFKERFGFWPLVHEGRVCDPATVGRDVQRAVWEQLERVRIERGYKPGWTGFQFQSRFGRWPPWRAAS